MNYSVSSIPFFFYDFNTMFETLESTLKKKTIYPYSLQNAEDITKPSKIVLSSAEELLNKGYCIKINNSYASPELFDILVANKTDAVGSVRYNQKKPFYYC